jgi:branched-chain amino acid transport system permease protein
MKGYRTRDLLLFGGLILLLAILPLLVSEYLLSLAITIIIYSLFALSYNILFGYGGLLSFGHAAYFGMGAYVVLILYKYFDCPLLLGILAGGVSGALLGFCFGAFLSRYRGMAFALLTVAFNQFVFITAEKWRGVTGGDDGLASQRPNLSLPGLGSIDMFAHTNWYYFVLIIVGLCVAYCHFFTKTPLGRVNMYMRENEERAGFIGYNTFTSKLLVYVITSFFAGLAGGLASSYQEFVSTGFLSGDKGGDILIMTFVGGAGTFWGPVVGVCFLTYIADVLSSMTKHWRIIQGAMFIALVMFAPQGIGGLVIRFKEWLKTRSGGERKGELNIEKVDGQ